MKKIIVMLILVVAVAACSSSQTREGDQVASVDSDVPKTKRVCERVRTNETGARIKRVCKRVPVTEDS